MNTRVGKKSGIACKPEAKAPQLVDFLDVLKNYEETKSKPILIVTDDIHISQEISLVKEKRYLFLEPEPAPRRIPDKVRTCRIFFSMPSYLL